MASSSPNAPRLLWLTAHYPPARGGMATSCDRIVAGLRRSGVVVDVVHLSERHARVHDDVQQGGRLLRVPLGEDAAHSFNRLWLRLRDAPRGVGAGGWDHVVAFGGDLILRGAPAIAAMLARPLTVLLRGNDLDVGMFAPRGTDTLLRGLAQARAVCVVCADHAEKVRALAPTATVHLVSNAVDVDDFGLLDSDHRRAAAFREAHGLADRVVVGLVGQLKQKKGADLLLEALARSGQAARVAVRVVGDVDEIAGAAIESARAAGAIVVAEPFRDRFELLEIYASLDWIALPSLYDGLPNVLLEAMACGVPAMVTRAGGLPDVVDDGRTGFVAEPDDLASLRALWLRALEVDGRARSGMGEAARRHIIEHHQVRHEVAGYRRCFDVDPTGPR